MKQLEVKSVWKLSSVRQIYNYQFFCYIEEKWVVIKVPQDRFWSDRFYQ